MLWMAHMIMACVSRLCEIWISIMKLNKKKNYHDCWVCAKPYNNIAFVSCTQTMTFKNGMVDSFIAYCQLYLRELFPFA